MELIFFTPHPTGFNLLSYTGRGTTSSERRALFSNTLYRIAKHLVKTTLVVAEMLKIVKKVFFNKKNSIFANRKRVF